MSDEHNVFMPHRHEDDHHIEALKRLLTRYGAKVRDSSIDSSKPNRAKNEAYIKNLIGGSIKWAGKILVLISPDTKNHWWVDWEINYASRYPDKRIIGVYLPGAGEPDIPEALKEYADAVVAWRGKAIFEAINGKDNWQRPDGAPASPQSIKRLSC